ncbi:glucohydrolase, partial [Erwinia amylovora]|uniref:alpha-amylase family glycosyl hydrolase n=1 Tax=Erwinia amylovora TaxID=552 RepID=UPI001007F543
VAEHHPDLRWDNARVREDLDARLLFWLDKGVGGLRYDTVAHYGKGPDGPDRTPSQRQNFARTYTEGPSIHCYINEMHRQRFPPYQIVPAWVIFDRPFENFTYHFDIRP